MKSISGHVYKTHNGLIYGKARKNSENRSYRNSPTNRKAGPHERAAIIMLRRKGNTYNQLAQAFNRSTSYIYKTCRTAMNRGTLTYRNYLKGLPHKTKMLFCGPRMGKLSSWMKQWQAFILGETDKPP